MKCPRCKKEYLEPSAISRADNKTEICSACGLEEAWDDYKEFVRRKNEN